MVEWSSTAWEEMLEEVLCLCLLLRIDFWVGSRLAIRDCDFLTHVKRTTQQQLTFVNKYIAYS